MRPDFAHVGLREVFGVLCSWAFAAFVLHTVFLVDIEPFSDVRNFGIFLPPVHTVLSPASIAFFDAFISPLVFLVWKLFRQFVG